MAFDETMDAEQSCNDPGCALVFERRPRVSSSPRCNNSAASSWFERPTSLRALLSKSPSETVTELSEIENGGRVRGVRRELSAGMGRHTSHATP
jgi:hypothetical protein